ncbi:MAG: hypothetical protein B6D37_12025 [Sphingobacteriales bacterium UTBCD1]|nr:MAG: hypothetical protein B6D37_12025 [Sphingobacteriales bacterium UTBCD1]
MKASGGSNPSLSAFILLSFSLRGFSFLSFGEGGVNNKRAAPGLLFYFLTFEILERCQSG